MVECRRYLDQGLEKTFLRLFQGEPDALPMLVSEEELSFPVTGKALRERSTIPIERHA
jgi:hypothetical protein